MSVVFVMLYAWQWPICFLSYVEGSGMERYLGALTVGFMHMHAAL